MPGPPRKPTAIKAAEGNPGKRRLPDDINLAPQEPEPPEWLDEGARAVWDAIVPDLVTLGVLRNTDQLQLACLCDACSIMLKARKAMGAMADGGLLIKTGNKGVAQNPLIGIVNRQKVIIHRLACEFGMTPAARARLMAGDIAPSGERVQSLEEILASDGSGGERYVKPERIH